MRDRLFGRSLFFTINSESHTTASKTSPAMDDTYLTMGDNA